MAVAVYKTDVNDSSKAETILDEIRADLPDSDVSFDLDDPDKVLRVEHATGGIEEERIRSILENHGHRIEQLS